MIRIFAVFIACFVVSIVYSQDQPSMMNISPQGLYHIIEMDELQHTSLMQTLFTPTPPPVGAVRNIAEFNRMAGVLIAYKNGFGIPYALIAEMAEDVLVYTLVTGLSQENTVRSLYLSNGVNLLNCRFIYAPTDSYWTRDYGPWFITTSTGDVGIVDFPYNRPRPNDNNIPVVMANALGISLYGMNLLHTGGNYMTDGMGISASTTLVATENSSLTTGQINQMVSDYLGIHTYHLNNDPLGQYIQHIDCWGKFLDVDKILIGEVPTTDSRYLAYEAVASYYATSTSSYGTPFQVHRVYAPNGQAYTNSLILNNKVLVPIASGATAALWNAPAIATYQQAMPGYEIIGMAQSSQAPWQTTDALHCRTKGIADIRPLYIHHIPLSGIIAAQPQYQIRAQVQAYADSGFMADSMILAYRVNGGLWDSLLMIPDTGHDWVAIIPGQTNGSTVSYFISSMDSTGRKEMHPFIGHADPHSFVVAGNVGRESIIAKEARVMIYPNPASVISFVKFNTLSQGNYTLRITDLNGRMVYQETFDGKPAGEQFISMDIRNWQAGTYVVNISIPEGVLTGKLVIIK